MARRNPSEDELMHGPDRKDSHNEEVKEARELAKAAKFSQDAADKFKSLACTALDPSEREKYLRQAYEKETEARGNSKRAQALASGWGQGAINGGGIGAAIGGGLGTVVGTLVGSIVALPTTTLGILGGTAVGAIHGPWVKFPQFSDHEMGADTPVSIGDDGDHGHQAVPRAAQQTGD